MAVPNFRWRSRSGLAAVCLAASGAYAAGLGAWSFTHPGWHSIRLETAWIVFAFLVLLTLAAAAFGGSPLVVDEGQTARLPAIPVLVTAVAGAVVYFRAPALGFLSDDFVLLGAPAGATGWVNGDSLVWRPLPLAVFHLADRTGQGALLLHLLNIGLHAVCAWLVWRIAIRLGTSTSVAFMATLLFVVFPASVEAVAWCAGLQDLLATTAMLLFVVLSVEERPAWMLVGALAIGLASKESAVAAPLLAGLVLWAARRRPLRTSTWRGLLVAAGIVAAFAVWRLHTAGPTFAASPSRYLLKKVASNAYSTLALPLTNAEFGQEPVWGVFTAVLMASAGVSVVLLWSRPQQARAMLTTLIWPIVAILPAYSIFFVARNLEGGRLLYTASAGWAIALAMSESTVRAVPMLLMRGAMAVVACLWCLAGYQQALAWQHASVARDDVLTGVAALPMDDCAGVDLIGVPDNIRGAYVFRNGLEDALKRRGPGPVLRPDGCQFVWTGSGFVRKN